MLASPSQTTQNNLLVDSSKPPALYDEVAEEEAEEVGVEEAEEAVGAEEAMTPTTTLTPLLLKLRTENSMGRSQQFSTEIER